MKPKALIITGISSIFLIALTVFFINEALTIARLANFFQGGAFILIPLFVTFVAAIFIFVGYEFERGVVVIISILAVLLGLTWSVIALVKHNYNVSSYYTSAIEEVTGATPTYNERAAFNVAEAQAPGSLGEVRGSIEDTSYIPDNDLFNSLVARPGWLQGYAAIISQEVDLTGQSKATSCEFSIDASAKIDGKFSHSLERKIAQQKLRAIVNDNDAYGYCDGDTPLVIVPLTKYEGWFPAVKVPAGVAVYNGSTGDLNLYSSSEEISLQGPTFPLSLAATIRNSTAALGSFWDYRANRVGYTDTSHDEGDPNSGNVSEFALKEQDGKDSSYVTPLTARGRATSIAALGEMQANAFEEGVIPAYTIYKFKEPRKPNSAVSDRLLSDYGDLPEWASGMEIFEITPVSDSEWVASLGREQNVNYRVRIQSDSTSCLETASGEELRCGKVTGTNGNSPGVMLAPDGSNSSSPVTLPQSPEEILELSNEDLATLQKQLNDEILSRLNASN